MVSNKVGTRMSQAKKKKKKGEKRDAYLVTDLDSLHLLMTSMMGSRTENEAVATVDIPMDGIYETLEKLNANNPEFKYTFFHLVCAAIFRTLQQRKIMNYFIRDGKFYERKEISVACIAKKAKVDGAEEGLVIMRYQRDSDMSPLEQIHTMLFKQVSQIRKSTESKDPTMEIVNKLVHLPRPLYKFVMWIIRTLDRKGRLPSFFADVDPYLCSCFASNIGSIKMNANYHHLINFGSNSFFLLVGKKTQQPVFNEDGTFKMKDFLPFSLTIDERIADGIYFANSIKLFKALLMKPENLLKPANESIDYDSLCAELGL